MIEKKYELVETDDGTYTVYLQEYDESMHSISGAYEEAVLKHVLPSKILEKNKETLSVLDVGFGLGYNILALIVELYRRNYNGLLEIVSFEKDDSFLPAMEQVKFDDMKGRFYEIIKKAFLNKTYGFENISFSIMFGDARTSVKMLGGSEFDAVFFDPFSPSKNPELWTVDFF